MKSVSLFLKVLVLVVGLAGVVYAIHTLKTRGLNENTQSLLGVNPDAAAVGPETTELGCGADSQAEVGSQGIAEASCSGAKSQDPVDN